MEQLPLLEVNNYEKGLFSVLALHYVFDMHYNARLSDFFTFFEEKILQVPISCKHSPLYASVTSAIECYLNNDN